MDNFISAIVPVYNVENYLRLCLNSIVNQKVPFDEVILVNDGSTDNSLKICEEYCNQYSYFVLLSQQNMGLSSARNAGIKASSGKYIVFIDSDDYIRDDMVVQLLGVLKDKDYDVLFYNAKIKYEEKGGEATDYFMRGKEFYNRDMRGIDYLMESFPGSYVVSACVAAYKKQLIVDKNIYFQEGMYFEDNVFCLQVCIMAAKVKCIEHDLYIRRYHSGTITANKKERKKLIDLIRMNEIIWDVLTRSDLDIYFMTCFVAFYFICTWDIISDSDYYKAVEAEWNRLLAVFHDMWVEKYRSKTLDFEDMAVLLLYYGGLEKDECVKDIRQKFETELTRRLKRIPLGEPSKKVGIYGIGRHTEKLFVLYKKYVGEISSDIFFIVSQKMTEENSYRGCKLVSCEMLSLNTDYIIISSLVYQEDMCRMLRQRNFDSDRIITLYRDDDFCDLVSVAKILEYSGVVENRDSI